MDKFPLQQACNPLHNHIWNVFNSAQQRWGIKVSPTRVFGSFGGQG